MTYEQNDIIKEIEMIKKEQNKKLQMKNTINKLKNSLEGVQKQTWSSRKKIGRLKDRSF